MPNLSKLHLSDFNTWTGGQQADKEPAWTGDKEPAQSPANQNKDPLEQGMDTIMMNHKLSHLYCSIIFSPFIVSGRDREKKKQNNFITVQKVILLIHHYYYYMCFKLQYSID